MIAKIAELISAAGSLVPQAAMKVVRAPIIAPPDTTTVPYNFWPWLVFGALFLVLVYVFQR